VLMTTMGGPANRNGGSNLNFEWESVAVMKAYALASNGMLVRKVPPAPLSLQRLRCREHGKRNTSIDGAPPVRLFKGRRDQQLKSAVVLLFLRDLLALLSRL
jgi:hypothetical protein